MIQSDRARGRPFSMDVSMRLSASERGHSLVTALTSRKR